MNHEEQNSVIVALIHQVKAELKGDIQGIESKLAMLQSEYEAVLAVQKEMLATQKAVKRIVKWASGVITFMIGVFELARLVLAVL